MLASSTSGCGFVYFAVFYGVQEDSTFLSSPGGLEASGKVAEIQLALLRSASCCTVL